MAEDKNISLSVVPESLEKLIDNAIGELSKSMGKSFEDIWELVIGNRLHYARKKQEDKYEREYKEKLEEYKKEIEKETNKICEEKQVAPDFYTISSLLEDSEFCLRSDVVRGMFARLIASSMNKETKDYVHPIFGHILKHMDHNDAIVFETIASGYSKHLKEINSRVKVEFSVRVLLQLGLINVGTEQVMKTVMYGNIEIEQKDPYGENDEYIRSLFGDEGVFLSKLLSHGFHLTELGKQFAKLCL